MVCDFITPYEYKDLGGNVMCPIRSVHLPGKECRQKVLNINLIRPPSHLMNQNYQNQNESARIYLTDGSTPFTPAESI